LKLDDNDAWVKNNIPEAIIMIINNANKYSIEIKRRFMLVKDAMKLQSYYGFKPVVVASNIKKNTAFLTMQEYEELPGIEVTMDPVRVYAYGE
jgi:penicillin-binding protein 2